ncbi:MAG: phosphodiester glycosidase family protein [Acidimicrobiales bacterium]
MAAVGLALVVFVGWLAISLGGALTNPAFGTSLSARFAEWGRQHGLSSVVLWAEKETYRPPPVGGKPPAGAIVRPKRSVANVASTYPHLPPPAALIPLASPPVAGEGQWAPAGRAVHGIPAVYVTTMRPDSVHTSQVVGVAWMDTKLLRATLYSGSIIPGGGPYTHTAPIPPGAATSLVAAFNSGFLMSSAPNSGYYTDGRQILPLQPGAASFVIYSDGSATVEQWGRDVTLAPNVVAVRQNLALVVDNGKPVPGLDAADNIKWGATLGGGAYVWRSGVGVTADGALVYVGGPSLSIVSLADVLADAGAVRAMELDINPDWVNFSSYAPPGGTGAAAPTNGTDLLPTMVGQPDRYFESWWARDFFTMSAR